MTYFFDDFSRFGNRTALIDDRGQEVTYECLDRWADAFKEKVEARQMAVCLCENSVGSPMGYAGFLRSRTVPLLLDRKIEEGLLTNLLSLYRPIYLYYPADMAGRFEDYEPFFEDYGYVLARALRPEPIELYPELGLLLTTSGSTGSPKLVRQSYRNIQANTESIIEYLKIDESERPITTLPMNYTYGLSIVQSHLAAGATILMTSHSMQMKAFWDFFKNNEATSFGGVPFTYEMLRKVRFFRMKLPSLRYMTQAGGKLSPELHREFAEWAQSQGKKFIVMYGQTEATARMGYLPAEYSIEKFGSMGFAIPGGRFELIGADDQVITRPDTTGELVYYGDNVTLGYAQKREDLALGDERGGCLHTGDVAKFDQDGFYYIVGRLKRFLKIFGNRVNLDEADRLIRSHFENVDCASTGVDDKMITYITDETRIDDVRRFLAATTHLSETAFEVRYIDEIPKNEAGKVQYTKLEK